MNLEVCSGLNIGSHTECGKKAVFCVSISSFSETTLKPGGDGTRAGGTRRQEQLPDAQENKLNPLLVFFVLLHCIIGLYAGAGTDSQLDFVNQPKLCCG